MKRLMALLLMLCIALTGMALAEDELYEEVDDSEFNEDTVVPVVGAVYPDKVLSDFDSNSPALYTARMTAYTSGYVERDIESERVSAWATLPRAAKCCILTRRGSSCAIRGSLRMSNATAFSV